MAESSLDRFVQITPGIMSGRPCIAGHRITVAQIAIWNLRQSMSVDQIIDDYQLQPAEVYAALAYYYDHQQEIDQSITETENYLEEMRRNTPSVLEEKLNKLRRA